MKLRLRLALAAALALPLLNGCGGTAGLKANVRLVNATSDYAGLDFYQSSTLLTSNVAAYTAGGYAEIDPDSYTFNLTATGTAATLVSTAQSVSKDQYYSIVAYTAGGTLATTLLSDEEPSPASGSAKLRVFNTDPADAGNVDVYLVSADRAALQNSSAAATATNVAGLQASFTPVNAASAGTAYHVCVTASGDKTDLRLDIPALTLTDQQVATLVLTRTSGGVLMNGVVVTQQGAATAALNTAVRLRVAASATAAGSVTATANGVSLGTAYVSPTVGTYTPGAGGRPVASVLIDNTAVPATGLSGTAGQDLTLLVAGSATAPAVTLITDDNSVSASTAKPVKLRIVNGLNGVAGAVTLTANNVNVGTAAFGAASASAIVAAGAATSSTGVNLSAISGGISLNSLADQTLTSGSVYSFFLLGDASAPTATLLVDR